MTAFARTLWLLVLGAGLVLAPAPVVAGAAEIDPAERVGCDAVSEPAPARDRSPRPSPPRASRSPSIPAVAADVRLSIPVRLHVLLCVWRE
jgi:hypothetical protein